MSNSDLTGLIALMGKYSGLRPLKRLQCARDVADELAAAGAPPPILTAWDRLAGTEVMVIPDYEPGRWKLVGHDHCTVIGGEAIDQAMIVSHENCTVLGESTADCSPACSRCGARPAPKNARDLCFDCAPGTPLCDRCYVVHAREALAGAQDDPATAFYHSNLRREKLSLAADVVRAADEQRAVREARLFLGSLTELTGKLLAEGYPDVAAWAEQIAATVKEWIAAPSDPVLHERVRLAMLEFNEMAGG